MPPPLVVASASAPANACSSSASVEAANNNPPPATRSYSAVISKTVVMNPLAPRPITYIDNTPAIILTQMESNYASKQKNTLIMKISVARPHLYDMWCHIHSEWDFESTPAVGTVDQRFVTLHMGSSSDTKRALAHTSNKIKTSLFVTIK